MELAQPYACIDIHGRKSQTNSPTTEKVKSYHERGGEERN